MMRIEKIAEDKVKYDGRVSEISIDSRGRRKKLWLGDEFLFKENLNADSNENKAEVLAFKLAKRLGISCVPYQLAEFVSEDGKINGVVSKNYRSSFRSVEEMSGKTVMDLLADKVYDNHKGQAVGLENTVDFYDAAIKKLFPDLDSSQVRKDLIKTAMFDYFVNQLDRHIFNITFLIHDGQITVSPLYDNAACFMLNYGSKKLSNISAEFAKTRNKDAFLNHTLHAMPMLGITTPTSEIVSIFKNGNGRDNTVEESFETEENNEIFNKFLKDTEKNKVFESELAEEIMDDSELKAIFEAFKHLDMNSIFDECENEGCTFNKVEAGFIMGVMELKISRISKLLDKSKKFEGGREF